MISKGMTACLPAALGAVLAVALVWNPIAAAALVALVAAGWVGVHARDRGPVTFLGALGILLAGYMLCGKGFAYLGVSPLFVGEITLLLGLITVASRFRRRLPPLLPSVAIVAFCAWGAARTLPYLDTYRVDALRDAALWGYAAFAFLIAAAFFQGNSPAAEMFRNALRRYAKFLPWFALWVPLTLFADSLDELSKIQLPGTGVQFFWLKAGDASVHLAGAGAFLLLGLHENLLGRRKKLFYVAFWAAWGAGFLMASALTRGGMLSVVLPLTMIVCLVSVRRWITIATLGFTLFVTFLTFDAQVDLGRTRKLSFQQLTNNVASIFGEAKTDLHGTKEWRLQWWGDIVDYTLFGEYFWGGKGFGVSLADDDGYQVGGGLRSPHNAHLTVLARAGVPGLVLWTSFLVLFGGSLALAYIKSRRQGEHWWAAVYLWLLAYWMAFLINASFDVFLEGPQGGIWFWSLVGFGFVALQARDRPGPGLHLAPVRPSPSANLGFEA